MLLKFSMLFFRIGIISGGYSDGVTPDPIPNSEVKPIRADGTWTVGSRKSRSLPDYILFFLKNCY